MTHEQKNNSYSVQELPKSYDAKSIDDRWYDFWEKNGFFRADALSEKEPFCIVIPPPNVTGILHMGHALVNTLQDIIIRWKRMSGFETLWVPGTDHAGISTQTVIERKLLLSTGKKRREFSREEFLGHIWKWKEESENTIIKQLKKLGCSCDWSRKRFTMDEGNNLAVRVIFKKLFDAGLIYQGDYLVNWDPVAQTAIADDEVEYEERSSFLWYFKYPLKDGSGFITIATTRPETLLGDTAIAVNPDDTRYSALIGKSVLLPLLDREIPIIADASIDPSFGTGAVKITPAHDFNDYQLGLKYKLHMINIMTADGHINENGGKFASMSMEAARKAVVEAMQKLNLVEKIVPHSNRVGVSYRSKATVEPYISKQWFVKMEGFAQKLQAAVNEKKVKLLPAAWQSTYFYWINNLRDWCISRQLWWGHQIPIWYNIADPQKMVCSGTLALPEEVALAPSEWVQDEDVLDTWFSSALWPFAALGWPNSTEELKRFYPNSTLITGNDILFFWVARMIMMGEYAMGEVPFSETFLHGLIFGKSYWKEAIGGGTLYLEPQERLQYELGKTPPSDVFSKWEKMSKSKGNTIDPLEVIEQYGTDAVRFTLCSSPSHQRQIDLDRRRFEEFKNFTNKIWNGARFVFLNLHGDIERGQKPLTPEAFAQGFDEKLLSLEDRWILSKLNHVIKNVNYFFGSYQFDKAAYEAYDFFWKEFCAYYVEIVKPTLFGKEGTEEIRVNKQKLLAIILLSALRIMHPIAPFITEELFQQLKQLLAIESFSENLDPYSYEALKALQAKSCMVSSYPQVIRSSDINVEIEEEFALLEELVYTLRNIRGEINVPLGAAIDVYLISSPENAAFIAIQKHRSILLALVKIKKLEFLTEYPQIGACSAALLKEINICVPIPEERLHQEKERLLKEQTKLLLSVEKIQKQLENSAFIEQAPAPLVEKTQKQHESLLNELKIVQQRLNEL